MTTIKIIKFLYSRLDQNTIKAICTCLNPSKLTYRRKDAINHIWKNYRVYIFERIQNRSLNKKLKALTITNKNQKAAKEHKLEFIENYVVNKSNEQFSQNNYRYLKKRLSYAVKEETIVDIEAGVKYAK